MHTHSIAGKAKQTLLPLAIVLTVASVRAQSPLLSPTDMPNAVRFLPPPPSVQSAAFAYDVAQYNWGKEQRSDTLRLSIAKGDAIWSVETICREMGGAIGIELSERNTPAIHRMLSVALLTTDQVGKIPKDHYQRTRPYVYYNEPTIAPGDEDALRNNGSYPSGHSILGWSAALLLTELCPEHADTILARGYMYGQSRVVAGYHWQSDVDAARLAASAAVARLHADPRFLRLMKKARREYLKVIKNARR